VNESSVTARYYDGAAARPRNVTVTLAAGRLSIFGEVDAREIDLRDACVSERLARAPRLITFADGTYLEVADHPRLDRLLADSGFRDSWVGRWQNHWPAALGALAAAVALLGLAYVYGLPHFARITAPMIPPTVEARIGSSSVQWLDEHLLAPSKLPAAQRDALAAGFARIAPRDGRSYRIEFRASRIGPNALALPDGRLVVTDELIELAGQEEAVMGVLAHELGHIEHRHLLRRLISAGVVGAATTLLSSDVSGVLAALPATLANLSYSRSMSREADRYAIGLLRAHDLPLEPLAKLFEAMEEAHQLRREQKKASGKDESAISRPDWTQYLSTHPDTAERIREIRAAALSRR
jgi:Zn-dependent protease with chaperone function